MKKIFLLEWCRNDAKSMNNDKYNNIGTEICNTLKNDATNLDIIPSFFNAICMSPNPGFDYQYSLETWYESTLNNMLQMVCDKYHYTDVYRKFYNDVIYNMSKIESYEEDLHIISEEHYSIITEQRKIYKEIQHLIDKLGGVRFFHSTLIYIDNGSYSRELLIKKFPFITNVFENIHVIHGTDYDEIFKVCMDIISLIILDDEILKKDFDLEKIKKRIQ